MKLLVTLCLMACLATVAWTSSASWGRREYNDFQLHYETVVARPRKNTAQSATVVFPRPGLVNRRNITAIFAYDNFKNNSGAIPQLWSGGSRYTFAQINLRGLYSSGFNTTVVIYGR